MAMKKKGRPGRAEKSDVPGAVARKARELKSTPEELASKAEYLRRWRAAKKQEALHPKPEDDPKPAPAIEVTADDIDMGKGFGDAVWGIVAPFASLKPLDDSQRERLGRALAPIIKKYMPLLGEWQYEAALLMVVVSLARENYVPPRKAHESEAEIVDEPEAAGV